MYNEKNANKAHYKVELRIGDTSDGRGDWVAMISHDSTGTEYFFGDERACWNHIDKMRDGWRTRGIELVQQSSNAFAANAFRTAA